MSFYDLPTSVEVGGIDRPIRSDYRVALDLIQVIGDPELEDHERTLLVLEIFYDDWEDELEDGTIVERSWLDIPQDDYQEAVEKAFWFIAAGKDQGSANKPKLMDWEQDFTLIAAPVNRVLGFEVREAEYLHWWSFLAAYYEIGDCLFAQVVSVRKKKAQGKKLDKADQAFANENADIVNIRTKTTAAEEATLGQWIG